MEFKDLNDLKADFVKGKFKFPENITVKGIPYHLRTEGGSKHSVLDMMKKNYKAIVIYQTPDTNKEETKKADLDQWILFLWSFTPKMKMIPYDVRTMSRARVGGKTITEKEVKEIPDNVIGSTVEVRFTNLAGSGYMKGKVDTGATICSLHADNYRINRDAGTITFKTPQLSPNELTVPMVDQQSVKSADGGREYRPVIELNIKVNNKLLNNVKFNLNDRSHMEYPILLGRNALEAGKFMINPQMDENSDWELTTTAQPGDDIDWIYIQEQFQNDVIVNTEEKNISELYTLIKESDVTFEDLVRYIRTDVTENVMEDLDD